MRTSPMHRTEHASLLHDGPVEQYITMLRRIRALEAQHEYTLAKRLREQGDVEAERRLITSQLRLVAKIAWRYRAYRLPFSKLICEGNRALLDAVKHYDPDNGYRLGVYAKCWVHLAIVDLVLSSWSDVRVVATAEKMTLFLKLCRLKAKLTALIATNRAHSRLPMLANATERVQSTGPGGAGSWCRDDRQRHIVRRLDHNCDLAPAPEAMARGSNALAGKQLAEPERMLSRQGGAALSRSRRRCAARSRLATPPEP